MQNVAPLKRGACQNWTVLRARQNDREFMRELVLRMERSERLMVAELADTRREFSAAMAEIKNELVENRAEQRAGREALFRMLDRFGPGDAPA
jgi:hypothetical protein